jgi:hypothetical protein
LYLKEQLGTFPDIALNQNIRNNSNGKEEKESPQGEYICKDAAQSEDKIYPG